MTNIEKRSARFGAAILIFSVLLRWTAAVSTMTAQAEGFSPHRPVGGITIGQRPGPTTTLPTAPTVTTIPQAPTTPNAPMPQPGIRFEPADMAYVRLRYATDCGYRAETETLLLQSVDWKLEDGPAVLIIHSHATESYTKTEGQTYWESGDYRTENDAYNMVAVGDALAELLQARGIGVLHDRQLHDYPSYNAAYTNSRKSVADYLREYPTIRIVLDLHRDAALNADGSQYATAATVNGERSAQVMLLVGTDWAGGSHGNWQDNLALALKLQALLEKAHPGITRDTLLRGYAFNQDLCTGMLIVEVGTAGNTLQEALRAMQPLADAIAAMKNGANTDA